MNWCWTVDTQLVTPSCDERQSHTSVFWSTMPTVTVVALVVVLCWLWRYRASIFPVHCTKCLERGRGCRGPHLKCSHPSLTPEQERTWQELRHVPGVRPRATPPHPSSLPDQDDTMYIFILTAFFIATVDMVLYC